MNLTMSQQRSVCSAIRAILSASLLIIIIVIQMNSQCKNLNCLLQLQRIGKLLQSQRKKHLLQVRQIEQSLEMFAKTKKEQYTNLQIISDKLVFKVEKYKSRCCNLNDRIKEQNQTIKSLNNKIAALQNQLRDSQTQVSKQKIMAFDQGRIISELRQVITLQQAENKELALKVKLQSEEIQNLYTQLALKRDIENRLRNAQFLSEEQYQRETALLRQTLKLQFSKSTSDVLSFCSTKKENEFIDEKKTINFVQENKHQQELRKLSNMIQYGSQFVNNFDNSELIFKESKNIYETYKSFIKKNKLYEQQINKLRESNQNLIENFRSKLLEIEQNVNEKQKINLSTSTQTPANDTFEQLSQTNAFLRLKLLQSQQYLASAVHFAGFLYHLKSYQRQKLQYYKRFSSKDKKVYKRKLKFKTVALSVLAIQYLIRMTRKSSKNHQELAYLKDINIADNRLNLILSKCLRLQSYYERKNPVVQKFLKQKANLNNEKIKLTFIQMIKQESMGISLSKEHLLDSTVYKIGKI